MGSRVGALSPLPIPQQAWSLLIHLFIHSFIQIVFVEHLLCVGPPWPEISKSQALPPGSSQSGGEAVEHDMYCGGGSLGQLELRRPLT